ncbi:MAG: Nif3-like dinuclear metal center hexameric protein [Puniceicoccales bacterium]|nr:Nif3-like dinuclear metal center hexameric protein [Puniceicoccales bacterium]
MVPVSRLVERCDELLNLRSIKDFPGAFNGLQVARREPVKKIGTAVDANKQVIQKALREGVDFLIVHHGLLWDGGHPLVGEYYDLYRSLLENDLAVYSAHLPLDAHASFGNNVVLAQKLGLEVVGTFAEFEGVPVGRVVSWKDSRAVLRARLEKWFGPIHSIEFGSPKPSRVGILSGSSGSFLKTLCEAHLLDTIVTGEVPHSFYSRAQLEKINLYACGHYATEIWGVRTFGERIAQEWGLPHTFIDAPSGL